jgi:hypothetical protein
MNEWFVDGAIARALASELLDGTQGVRCVVMMQINTSKLLMIKHVIWVSSSITTFE